MRPFRTYSHRYTRPPVDTQDWQLTELTIRTAGRTPCRARAAAFRLLEQRLVQDGLPLKGWRLISQTRVPERS